MLFDCVILGYILNRFEATAGSFLIHFAKMTCQRCARDSQHLGRLSLVTLALLVNQTNVPRDGRSEREIISDAIIVVVVGERQAWRRPLIAELPEIRGGRQRARAKSRGHQNKVMVRTV